ncbi:metal ABC transporter solute-binding protein, Zn/Mn family [Kineosporia sp. R_H_3]|uniref:metal ABC transporter substrate-binding protein n=1 Tax=Kineosporia sp. R_H_3 TaxID=1961848 RepID=UPI000B4BDE8A|nr:zinc ABC transporter substrate-binding protein [Kineosporia sp. R_H_3]
MLKKTAAVSATLVALTTLAACGGSSSGGGTTSAGGGKVAVVASFYPLQYAAQRVGGDAVSVTNLTKPGAEPHDLELSPKDVAAVADAGLVVYLSGFQPAVDEAVKTQAGDKAFDAAGSARLDLEGVEEEHEGEEGAEEAGHSATDPHFWLDPTRLADVGDALAARLGQADPAQAATFTANAAALRKDLEALDGEMKAGLATCTNKDVVTSHQAFGYLAQRYGLTQVGITGLSPEAEPDAKTIAKVTDFVRANDVTTIYYETLVSPAVAKTVASETGAKTAVLDPIEGISDASAAQDYLGVMRANLAALRAGQPCS